MANYDNYLLHVTGPDSLYANYRTLEKGLESQGFSVDSFFANRSSLSNNERGIVALVETNYFREDTFRQHVRRYQPEGIEVVVIPLQKTRKG
jgi:hypothetical protein